MTIKLVAIFVALGLVSTSARVARSEVQEIEAGGMATFGWSPASGPVDHYEVQIATEADAPFSWSHFRYTDADELTVSVSSGAIGSAHYVTVRTIAYDAIGNASQPSAVSSTVRFLPPTNWLYSVPDDFNGDSIPDVLVHDESNGKVVLFVEGQPPKLVSTPTAMVGDWEIVAQGDFDGDSREDLFWRHRFSGDNRLWLEVGGGVVEEDFFESPELANVATAWEVIETGDFDGDGRFDLLWHNQDTYQNFVWFMQGAVVDVVDFPSLRSASWFLEASADFDGNGTTDFLWHHLDDGRTAAWFFEGDGVEFASLPTTVLGSEVRNVSDFNRDGSADLVWFRADGSCEIWLMPDGERFEGTSCPAAE